MKTNHRDGTKKRQDHKANFRGPVRFLKNETVQIRRAAERRLLDAVACNIVDADDASLNHIDRVVRLDARYLMW